MRSKDFKGLFKKSDIYLRESRLEIGDIYTFEFGFYNHVYWIPGQHAIFTFPDKKIHGKSFRAFSIASVKREGKIMISTRIGDSPSSFKQALMELKPGEPMNMRGPFGWFYIRDYERPVAMIAGGIGITPVRALIKNIQLECRTFPSAKLIFSDSRGSFAYKKEIEDAQNDIPNFNSAFVTDRISFNFEIESFVQNHGNSAMYFLSGSPAMIMAVRKQLKSLGISRSNIVNDPFFGY